MSAAARRRSGWRRCSPACAGDAAWSLVLPCARGCRSSARRHSSRSACCAARRGSRCIAAALRARRAARSCSPPSRARSRAPRARPRPGGRGRRRSSTRSSASRGAGCCAARPRPAGAALAAAVVAPGRRRSGPAVGDSIVDTPWRRGPPAGRRGRRAADRRRHRRGLVRHRLPRGRRQARARLAGRARPDDPRAGSAAGARAGRRRASSPSRKICTHAGCAIALYRKPALRADAAPPALACPCHYSLFDTRRAARSCSAPPAGRCPSCRSRSARTASCAPPAASAARSAPPGGARADEARPARRFVDERVGAARPAAQGAALRLPRPLVVPARRDRALRFIVLVGTGIFLALFFEPSTRRRPTLDGVRPSRSARYGPTVGVNLSFDVPAGLLMRQTHHWAALTCSWSRSSCTCCGSSSPARSAARAS